jgi:3-hydroxyacyl-[acyl-carrier-protein] dehydratase
MRWMWIDRVTKLVPGEMMVAVKAISSSEEHLHDHFPADAERGLPSLPIMPATLVMEGMAQTAGVLVGHAGGFKEKVVLAKVNRAEFFMDVTPGFTLRYTATMDRYDETGAATTGVVHIIDTSCVALPEPAELARIDLLFSHIDRNRAGAAFPERNFVFSGDGPLMTLLRMSGVELQ